MSEWMAGCVLVLGQGDGAHSKWKQLGDHWGGGQASVSPVWVLGPLCVALAVVLGLWVWKLVESRGERPMPIWTFVRLGWLVGLGPMELWMLWRIARAQGLVSPLMLLVSRGTLRHYYRRWAQGVGQRRRARLGTVLARVERRAFPVAIRVERGS